MSVNHRERAVVEHAYRPEIYRHGGVRVTPHYELTTGLHHDIWIKDEGQQVTGSFKARGAHYAIARLAAQDNPQLRLITASAGNHGAGVADAARCWNLPTTVYVSAAAPRCKKDNIVTLGEGYVELREVDGSFDDAQAAALRAAESTANAAYVPPFNCDEVITGQGTCAQEILVSRPDVTHIFVPVGGGGLLAGTLRATSEYTDVHIVGVQFEGNNSAEQSVLHNEIRPATNLSHLCEGSAVSRIGELVYPILRHAYMAGRLSFVTVSAADIGEQIDHECRRRESLLPLYKDAAWDTFSETTGFMSLAGAYVWARQNPSDPKGKWSCITTGSNGSDELLSTCHQAYLQREHSRKGIAQRACNIVSRPFC